MPAIGRCGSASMGIARFMHPATASNTLMAQSSYTSLITTLSGLVGGLGKAITYSWGGNMPMEAD